MERSSANNSRLKGMSIGGAIKGAFKILPPALTIGFPVMTYLDKREQGESVLKSGAIAGAELAAWSIMPGVMTVASLAPMIPDAVSAGIDFTKNNRSYVSRMYQANFGGNYVDTQMAGTMRQAGMYNINQSKGSIQSKLGSEAKSFYRRTR